jgi:hypothetical protein
MDGIKRWDAAVASTILIVPRIRPCSVISDTRHVLLLLALQAVGDGMGDKDEVLATLNNCTMTRAHFQHMRSDPNIPEEAWLFNVVRALCRFRYYNDILHPCIFTRLWTSLASTSISEARCLGKCTLTNFRFADRHSI